MEEGDLFIDRKEYSDALDAYEEVLRLDPKDALACCSKGAALNGLKRYEEALAVCQYAIRLDPKDTLIYIESIS